MLIELTTSLAEHAHAFLLYLVIRTSDDVLEQLDLITNVVQLTGDVELAQRDLLVVAFRQHQIQMLNRVDQRYRLLLVVSDEVFCARENLFPFERFGFGVVVVALCSMKVKLSGKLILIEKCQPALTSSSASSVLSSMIRCEAS